jgi:outer membrane lipoprotein-sorting protein
MRRLRTQSARRLALIAASAVALVVCVVGIAQAVGDSSKPPAKPLAQALLDASNAPAPQGITARISFTNNLLPGGSLPQEGGASPLLTGATGRLWLTNDGRVRLELQSDAGDAQIVSDGKTFSIYDATSNTVYKGALPQDSSSTTPAKPDTPPTLAHIQDSLNNLAKTWTLSGATPTNTAGQPSYTVRISPKDDGGLLGAAEVAWDAAKGVPLRAAVYAQGQSSPVLELKATDISYGKIADSDVDVQPPASAKVVQLNPKSGHDAQGKPADVTGLSNVQQKVDFPVSAPSTLSGLPLQEVRLVQFGGTNGALATYGQGLGGILVFQEKGDGKPAQNGSGGRHSLQLPTINIDGATGTELGTALGTIVEFQRNGVNYVVAGSVPPVAAENAARGLK